MDETVLPPTFARNVSRFASHDVTRQPDVEISIDVEPVCREDWRLESEKIEISRPERRTFQYSGPRIHGRLRLADESNAVHRGEFRTVCRSDHIMAIINIAVSGVLAEAGGLLLHASSIETTDGSIAFMGGQGAGKSTAAEMLTMNMEGCLQISNDICFVLVDLEDGVKIAPGLFEYVKEDQGRRKPSVLRAICHVCGWGKNTLLQYQPSDALAAVMTNIVFWTPSGGGYDDALACIEGMIRRLPVYMMSFCRNTEFVEMISGLSAAGFTKTEHG